MEVTFYDYFRLFFFYQSKKTLNRCYKLYIISYLEDGLKQHSFHNLIFCYCIIKVCFRKKTPTIPNYLAIHINRLENYERTTHLQDNITFTHLKILTYNNTHNTEVRMTRIHTIETQAEFV